MSKHISETQEAQGVIRVDLDVDTEMEKWMASFGVNAASGSIKEVVASAKFNIATSKETKRVIAHNDAALALAKQEWKDNTYVPPGKKALVIKFNHKAKPKKRAARAVQGMSAPELPARKHAIWTNSKGWDPNAPLQKTKESSPPPLPNRRKPPPVPKKKLPPPFPKTKSTSPPPGVRKQDKRAPPCVGCGLNRNNLLHGGLEAGDLTANSAYASVATPLQGGPLFSEHALFSEGKYAKRGGHRAGMTLDGALTGVQLRDGLLHGGIEQGDLCADCAHAALAVTSHGDSLLSQYALLSEGKRADSDANDAKRSGMRVQGLMATPGVEGLLRGGIEQGDLNAQGSRVCAATCANGATLLSQHALQGTLQSDMGDDVAQRRPGGLTAPSACNGLDDHVHWLHGGIEQGDLGMDEYWCGDTKVAKTSRTRHMGGFFDDVIALSFADQAQYFLDVYWDELGDHAEGIYSILYHFNRLVDMQSQGLTEAYHYQEGQEVDFNVALHLFDCVQAHFQAVDGQVQATRFPLVVPEPMQAITRKQALLDVLDPMFNGKVNFLEVLLFQFEKTPADLQAKADAIQIEKKAMAASSVNKLNADLAAARAALAEVERRIKKFEKEKARLRKLAKGTGVKALGALNMLAQLESSPFGDHLRRALITAQAAVRKLTKDVKKATTKTTNVHMDGSVWWLTRDLQAKQLHLDH